MDTVATPGAWKRTLRKGFAVAALWVAGYVFPPVAPLLALLLPLAVCPEAAQGRGWFVTALILSPATAFIAGGGDVVMGLLLPTASCLCLLMNAVGRRAGWRFHAVALSYMAAVAMGVLALLMRLSYLLGGTLPTQLADALVATIRNSLRGGSILYRLVSLGYLSVPDAYSNTAAFQFGDLVLLAPGLRTELLNMLRLRLTESFTSWIPTFLVQGSVIVGLFSALLASQARAIRLGVGMLAQRFSTLRLTRSEQGLMLVLCVATLVTGITGGTFLSLLSALMYAFFAAVYQLLGAAVLIALFSRKHPRRAALHAILCAFLYLVFPIALFMLGVMDQFIHLRGEGPNITKEE